MKKHLLAVLCLLIVSMGMACGAESTEIKITNPSNNSSVSRSIAVEGTLKNISTGQSLWIMVYPDGVYRYYPQDIPIDIRANGNWSIKGVGIGSDTDSRREFKIYAVLANETGNKAIIDYLTSKTWAGMENLPDGAIEYDYVSVTRK